MSELNIEFHPDELLTHKKKPSQLPRYGGPKKYAPDNDEDDEALTLLIQEQRDILKEQRVCKKGNLSVGTWNAKEQVAEISVVKGPHWQHFGTRKLDVMLLQPEEALFLLEQGSLELYYGGLPLSFQQAFMTLLSEAFPPEYYLVYAYFLRLGFTVLHHRPRNKDTANTTTEEVETEETEEEPKAGAMDKEECAHETVTDNDKASIPSHVSHLWAGQGACTPLVRPKDATSTAAILSKLQVIKPHRMITADICQSLQHSVRVVFDVYQPGLNFKKTDPGAPAFCVSVCRYSDPPPSLAGLTLLRKECFPVPLKIALVDGGSISFYSVLDVDSPTFITRG